MIDLSEFNDWLSFTCRTKILHKILLIVSFGTYFRIPLSMFIFNAIVANFKRTEYITIY